MISHPERNAAAAAVQGGGGEGKGGVPRLARKVMIDYKGCTSMEAAAKTRTKTTTTGKKKMLL